MAGIACVHYEIARSKRSKKMELITPNFLAASKVALKVTMTFGNSQDLFGFATWSPNSSIPPYQSRFESPGVVINPS